MNLEINKFRKLFGPLVPKFRNIIKSETFKGLINTVQFSGPLMQKS